MLARRVSARFGCLLFWAALSINAQFVNENCHRYGIGSDIGTVGMVPDTGRVKQYPGRPDGTISIKRLNHKIPGKAAKEYEKGSHLRETRKLEGALSHFQKALQIDPEFVEAANDIGVTYADLNRPADAQAAFEKTIKIDPQYWSGYFNLAIIDLAGGHFADAERAARSAMDLNRAGSRTRVVLGMALVIQDKFSDEAINLLESTGEEYPQAHLFLARALAGKGKKDMARKQIQLFLRSPQTKDEPAKTLAERWLQALADKK
jgi:tetratricopeptide (TPR) repeat protein